MRSWRGTTRTEAEARAEVPALFCGTYMKRSTGSRDRAIFLFSLDSFLSSVGFFPSILAADWTTAAGHRQPETIGRTNTDDRPEDPRLQNQHRPEIIGKTGSGSRPEDPRRQTWRPSTPAADQRRPARRSPDRPQRMEPDQLQQVGRPTGKRRQQDRRR